MNYHYKKAEDLRRQLLQLENSLKGDYKSYQKLKLESQFYQDNKYNNANINNINNINNQDNNMNIADQIMTELINNPVKIQKQSYNIQQIKQTPIIPSKAIPQISPIVPSNQPINKHQNQFYNQLQFKQQVRQNNFINQRQVQKNKLQNQKHQGLFPNSSDHNRQRSYGKQPIVQEIPQQNIIDYYNQPIIKPNIQSPNRKNNTSPPSAPINQKPVIYNPFLKNQQIQKQKKLQKQRQHLRQLQQQRIQQQKKKEQRQRQQKLFKGQQYDHFATNKQVVISKKTDPNGIPPKIVQKMGNYSQFDSNLIRSKAIQIKSRYRKGKIIYQQYQRQLNNLKKQYPGNFDQLIDQNISKGQDKYHQQEYKIQTTNEPIRQSKQVIESQQIPQDQNKFILKNDINSFSQYIPQMPNMNIMNPNLNFSLPQQSMMHTNQSNISPQYIEFFKKMFQVCVKQVKDVYAERIVQQDHNYQQTLQKIYLQTQQNFHTQQIPHIQERQVHTDAKHKRQSLQKQSNKKKNILSNINQSIIPPYGQQNTQYYDKSLSAIASKVPFHQNSQSKIRPQKTNRSSVGLNQFYKKKYKIKKLQNFPILININQSQLEIPSTSTYIKTNNALQQLQYRFNEDLQDLKRLQIQKNVNKLSNKMHKNYTYSSQKRVVKEPILQTVQSGYTSHHKSPQKLSSSSKSKQKVDAINPFLKKHVSNNDDNMMTFNQRQLQLNSPIYNYSPKKKVEILQQDQYQTQPRVKQQSKLVPSYIQEYQQRLNVPNKALNFIKMNNKILKKYQKTQQSAKNSSQYIKQNISKDYFNNNSISPVKKSQNYYQQSLETIKSDFQDPQKSYQYIKIQDHQQKVVKSPQKSNKNIDEPQIRDQQMVGYSQTVESVQESSARVSRPPIAKKRHLSKKKQSSIARSKLNNDIHGSRSIDDESNVNIEPSKFDSNVYESQYQQSIQKMPYKINNQLVQNKRINKNINDMHIQVYPPIINAPKAGNSPKKTQQNNEQQSKSSLSKYIQPQGRLKSLEQARKLAKECRKQKDQSKQYRSIQQRVSQLQSFMTKKGDQSYSVIKQQQFQSNRPKNVKRQPRNIMKMLQSLQSNIDQDYKQEFDSYRQQSQNYQ